MYELSPARVYVFDELLEDELSVRRVEKMLGALGRDLSSTEHVTDADVPEMIRLNNWQTARRYQGTLGEHTDPALVFRRLRMEDAPEISTVVKACPPGTSPLLVGNLLGHGGRMIHDEGATSGRICRSRYQFDTIYGCPHGCQYCTGGKVAVIFTNIEEFIEKQVVPTAIRNPWQKVFLFNACLTDELCFEPEYGLSKLLDEYFASTTDQYWLIHTKSANVASLLELDHAGHTILLWSLTSETVSRVIEPGSASTEERIEAARQCQEAGYPVRFKFKPIVPVRNWRTECRHMIERVFVRTRPESIGVCMIAWMTAEQLAGTIDTSLLDPDCVKAMEGSAEAMKNTVTGPFPHEVRSEAYSFFLDEVRRHDRDVPVYLCTESPQMWGEFAPRLGSNPGNYVCGCGPQCPPGTAYITHLTEPAEVG